MTGGVFTDVRFPRVHLSQPCLRCLDRGIHVEKVRCYPEEAFSISSRQPGRSLIFL